MPHVKVRIRAALPAGLAAAVIWEISKIGFATYLKSATHYNLIYGPLAALPLFFLWVFISWAVVLFGAQLTFAQDAVDDIREEELAGTVSLRERIRVALHLVFESCRRYREEKPAPELVEISHSLSLPLRLVRQVADVLTDGGLIYVVQSPKEGGIAPARAPERITIYEIVACLVDRGHVPRAGRRDRDVDHILDQIGDSLQDRWGEISVEECLSQGTGIDDVLPLRIP
jgi:membrane protein